MSAASDEKLLDAYRRAYFRNGPDSRAFQHARAALERAGISASRRNTALWSGGERPREGSVGQRRTRRTRKSRDASSFRREIAEVAVSQGWRVEQTEKGHWRFIPPDRTKRIVILPGSSVSRSGMRNALADLRRSGLVVARDSNPEHHR